MLRLFLGVADAVLASQYDIEGNMAIGMTEYPHRMDRLVDRQRTFDIDFDVKFDLDAVFFMSWDWYTLAKELGRILVG